VAEPEDLLAQGALVAGRLARQLWARRAGRPAGRPPELSDLRRRLELLLAALFPEAPEIAVAEPPARPPFLARLARRSVPYLTPLVALPSTDGNRIRLPRELEELSAAEVPARYRLLALEQAVRAERGTPAYLPSGDVILRDLFLLSEAAAVDTVLAKLLPGIVSPLREARAEQLSSRMEPHRASPKERAVEALVRVLLAADPATPPAPFAAAVTPARSVTWAEEQASNLAPVKGRYRGMMPVALWGVTAPVPDAPAPADGKWAHDEARVPAGRVRRLHRRPRVRQPDADEDDKSPGTWIVRADDPQEKAEDPAGLQRPADRDDDADPGELADALSELEEARLVRTASAPREVLTSDDPPPRAAVTGPVGIGRGLVYPEWDWRVDTYRQHGALVRECAPDEREDGWAEHVLRSQSALVRRVRRDFERLRPRRAALRRQPDGAELDVDAYVSAFSDARGRRVVDDRCYIETRPLRRDAALTLLVDASASTDGWVAGDRRVIDVEKEALLIVCEALSALGDPYGVIAFSGEGPERVEVRRLKGFRECSATLVRRRIAALEPSGYTRVGAAVRHATACLAREPAQHRVLLVLSDGRPNDVDVYEGRYGVEDTRVAVAEARLLDVNCFCLTIDREAPSYAARIFGGNRFAVLSRPERLPAVLPTLLRSLVRR
jgi:nitric oxide reductase NorD protein